jgi:hypothetical protein
MLVERLLLNLFYWYFVTNDMVASDQTSDEFEALYEQAKKHAGVTAALALYTQYQKSTYHNINSFRSRKSSITTSNSTF